MINLNGNHFSIKDNQIIFSFADIAGHIECEDRYPEEGRGHYYEVSVSTDGVKFEQTSFDVLEEAFQYVIKYQKHIKQKKEQKQKEAEMEKIQKKMKLLRIPEGTVSIAVEIIKDNDPSEIGYCGHYPINEDFALNAWGDKVHFECYALDEKDEIIGDNFENEDSSI